MKLFTRIFLSIKRHRIMGRLVRFLKTFFNISQLKKKVKEDNFVISFTAEEKEAIKAMVKKGMRASVSWSEPISTIHLN